MKLVAIFLKVFRKPPHKTLEHCKKIVDILLSLEPEIEEIRLFGSYSKGTFTSQSDIDIGVFLPYHRQDYFYETLRFISENDISMQMRSNFVTGRSPAIDNLRLLLDKDLEKISLPEKYDIHLFSKDTIKWRHVLEAKRGILLYSVLGQSQR